jgi:hypothetical protein
MRPIRRLLALAASAVTLAAGLAVATAPAALAAESVPPLQYPAVNFGTPLRIYAGASGTVTNGCRNDSGSSDTNLRTYGASGQLTRDLPRTNMIDGVENCINEPAVDKNGVAYGVPYGRAVSGTWQYGPNLLAFDGNTLKWKYPVSCGVSAVVGANGNVYALTKVNNQVHLIGLKPELDFGQTQPTKVMDVAVPNDCGAVLSAYKDGIMLHGYSTSGARFYGYAGTSLGQTTGFFGYEKLNFTGQMFYAVFASASGIRSASIAMYDPLTEGAVWTTTASTPGADVAEAYMYPLATGGVAVLLREQKMVADNVPASPKE